MRGKIEDDDLIPMAVDDEGALGMTTMTVAD
jgi:hypothetical protein